MNGMPIGQWMSRLLGNMRFAGEPKSLELRVGQIVRGVVLQMLQNQDALVQIDDMQIRARLETPLRPGQATFLQVMPEGANGQIVLKAVDHAFNELPSSTLSALLKSLNVKEDEAARHIVQYMRREGIPISADHVRAWQAAIQSLQQHSTAAPSMTDMLHTLGLARQLSLPLTGTTIASLHQVLFGPTLPDLTAQLQTQIQTVLQSESRPSQNPLFELLGKLLTQSRNVLQTISSGHVAPQLSGPSSSKDQPAVHPNDRSGGASGVHDQSGRAAGADLGGGRAAAVTGAATAATANPMSGMAAAAAEGNPAVGRGIGQAAMSDAARQASHLQGEVKAENSDASGRQAADVISGRTGRNEASGRGGAADAGSKGNAGATIVQTPPQAGAISQEAVHRAERPSGNDLDWIPRLLKSLGVDMERQWSRWVGTDASSLPSPTERGAVGGDGMRSPIPAESLKAMLMQLLSSADDLPQPLREAAQQTVQHITGQQLLLAGDRGTTFAHMTLFIPFSQDQGERPAAIHIQARKKSAGGAIDASNCRLLFDLHMRHLGDTIVDAHVVDRSVHITLMNNHPLMAEWMNAAKEGVTQAMAAMGYHCAIWKCAPLPAPAEQKEHHDTGKRSNSEMKINLDRVPKPYKGVDFRI